MKFAIAFAALVAVALAGPYQKPMDSSTAELEAIIAAIQSPSTDPATAALLEAQLQEIIGAFVPSPSPAIVEPIEPHPIAIGPALIDFPLPDGGAVSADLTPVPVETAVVPAPVAPVVVGETAAQSTPLVQIILNINSANTDAVAVEGAPAAAAPVAPAAPVDPIQVVEEAVNEWEIIPTPVQVVEVAPETVQVVESAPEPVLVAEIKPEPVQVVEVAPEPVAVAPAPAPVVIAPQPVQVGSPIMPAPVVTVPDTLN